MTDADRKQQIADARQKLLEKRLKAKGVGKEAQVVTITPKPDDAPALASLGQQRLWYIQQMQAKSTAYHMTNLMRITGQLDSTALEQGLQVITEQQAILRTGFTLADGALIQMIEETIDLPFQQMTVADDASALAESHTFADTPFDLSQAPLWRALLIHVDDNTHYFMLVLHHIISDEWSLDILWNEIARAYQADEKTVSAVDIQYVDYAHWQHQQIQANAYEQQLDYWREQLAGDLPLLNLPTDHPRPAIQQFKGGLLEFTLDPRLSDALQAISKANNTTLFTTLLSAYQVLLHRYTSQTDILVGTPVANRKLAQTENLIGFFLNTIVLRTNFTEELSFNQHLTGMTQQALKALSHQDLPFDMLVDDLKPKRDPSYNPIFQTMFVYQNSSAHQATLGNLELDPIQIDANVAKFDLTVFARLDADHIQLGIEYDTALFDSATVERLMTHYRTLLESIVSAPDTAISQLAILPKSEHDLLASFNSARQEYPQDKLIHDLITAHPHDALALESDDGTLTYGELIARANYLAQQLVDRGITPDTPVGLCVERSHEMLIGILGILLAGGAYVPIDPNYPSERMRYVIADAGIKVLVTQESLQTILADYQGNVMLIDEETQAHPPEISTTPDNLAYLIYTSGSTGQPKGVRVTHRNLVHSTTARFTVYEHPVEKFLLLSSFAFDSSLVGIFWTLCQGATLCLPPHEGEKDIQQVATLIQECGITHLLALPSLYQILLEFSDDEQLATLKTVIVAGEACTITLADLHHQQLPDAKLYNEYGPTEGTVWASVWQIPAHADKILIGQPIPNMQIYIVGDKLQVVPLGVIGELLIGGDGLAQGYHNQAELTAERFVENPFAEGKLYHTGDLGRYLADGTIEFIGRKDFQVKISGYRIELGEIETALLSADAVQEAVVIPITDKTQTKAIAVDDIVQALHQQDGSDLLADIEDLSSAEVDTILETLLGE